MRIEGIVWLQRIIEKLITKHHIKPEEVEQVFMNSPQYRLLEKGKIDNENVYSAYGRTNGGRYITIIFIKKYGNRALIISARDMDRKERKQYVR
ncbi:MAG: BrnT family toxin [Thermoplasmata archaeon]|nr:BrnT family toxin [Thermoplasmata archaeon]